VSEDPIGFTAEDTNLSRYVFNNSIGYVDFTGELTKYTYYSLTHLSGKKESKIRPENKNDNEKYKLSLKTESSYSREKYSISITAEASFYNQGVHYSTRREKTVELRCNNSENAGGGLGELMDDNCGASASETINHVSVAVNIGCSYNEQYRRKEIFVYGAAAYTLDAQNINFGITVNGTGGNITYTFKEDKGHIDEKWIWKYYCKCETRIYDD
jgi:hypothetical protein